MKGRLAGILCASIMTLAPVVASARCSLRPPPPKRLSIEEGVSTDTLTKNRGTWHQTSLVAIARNGATQSTYARIAEDERFGATDTQYEIGAYRPVATHVIGDAILSFSPQHHTLPASALEGDLDIRSAAGYGYQIGYEARNYSAVGASIERVGADRYFRDLRVATTLTVAHLSNVSGLALSEGASVTRYLSCDTELFAVSTGRDVENTGFGAQLAVYHSLTFNVSDLHWLSPHFGIDAGLGWDELTGAYNRFEVRFALRERI